MVDSRDRAPEWAPKGLREFLQHAGAPVFGLAQHPRLEQMEAIPVIAAGHYVSVSLSYSYFQIPEHRDHPVNRVALTPQQQAAVDRAASSNLPEELRAAVLRMQYPVLWDAVRTSLVTGQLQRRALRDRLSSHLTDVVQTLAGTRGHPGPRPSIARATQPCQATLVGVDGSAVRGIRLEHPDVAAIAFEADRRCVTAAVPKKFLSSEGIAFESILSEAGAASVDEDPQYRHRL